MMDALPGLGLAVLRLGLSVLALAAAAHKLAHPVRSRRATAALIGGGGAVAGAAWGAAILMEVLGGLLTLSAAFSGRGVFVLAAVWLCYAVVLGIRQRSADCGCGFGQRSPGHRFGLFRNLLLVGLALFVGVAPVVAVGAATWLAAAPGALAFFLLYLAVDELGSHPHLARIRS